jgi:hypothetical protein
MATKQDIYSELSEVCKALRCTLIALQTTMHDIRTSMTSSERVDHNIELANDIFHIHGYFPESFEKLKQWGVVDAFSDEQVYKICYEVIDYRHDKTLHSFN